MSCLISVEERMTSDLKELLITNTTHASVIDIMIIYTQLYERRYTMGIGYKCAH